MCRSYTTAFSAPAKSGGFLARMASRLGLRSRVTQSLPPVVSGRAVNTEKLLTPDGGNILTPERLRARALLQNNRDLQQVEAYVRVHQILARGRCSNAN